MRTNVPRALKALRLRRRWRQVDLGRRAGLSRYVVQRAEAGKLHGLTFGTLARMVAVLDAELAIEVRWQGADLDRLIDQDHAALVATAALFLEIVGWMVRVEVSFNHFGDRGRCDIVGWHPASRTLLVVEVKTRLGDLQDTLGRLDVKARLGVVIAKQLGWGQPTRVVPALVLAEVGSNRRAVRRHEALFRAFGLRGRDAMSWLRRPGGQVSGLLWFESPNAAQVHTGSRSPVSSRRRAG